MKHPVAAIEGSGTSSKFMRHPDTDSKTEPRRLKLAQVHVFCTPVMTFFDSGTIPDVLSTGQCQMLHLTSNSTNRIITMVDNKETAVIGEVSRVPIKEGLVTFRLSFSVVQTTPYHLIIGCPSMKTLQASLDIDKVIVTFRYGGAVTRLPLVAKCIHEDVLLSDEFICNRRSDDNGEETDNRKDNI